MKYASVCSGVEEWRNINGYEDFYQVSNLGNVRRITSHGYRLLKPVFGSIVYPTVHLSKDSIRKRCTIHRLVANAFLPNPENLPQVNHKDENPCNNNVENLEWCTEVYNHNYGTCKKRIHEKLSRKIYSVDLYGNKIEYDSIHDANRKTGIERKVIANSIAFNRIIQRRNIQFYEVTI